MSLAQGFVSASGQPAGYRHPTKGSLPPSGLFPGTGTTHTGGIRPGAGGVNYGLAQNTGFPKNSLASGIKPGASGVNYGLAQSTGVPRSGFAGTTYIPSGATHPTGGAMHPTGGVTYTISGATHPTGGATHTIGARSSNAPMMKHVPIQHYNTSDMPVHYGHVARGGNVLDLTGTTPMAAPHKHRYAAVHRRTLPDDRSSSKDHTRASKRNKGSKPSYNEHHSRRGNDGSSRHEKQRIWDKVFCMNSNKYGAGGHKVPTRHKGFDQLRLDDNPFYDVDLLNNPAPRGPFRTGPQRRNSADLNITVRDLFPCIGDVLDTCGLGKKRTRMLNQPIVGNRSLNRNTPQLETVCLDCGHVLDKHHLDKSVLRDAIGLSATMPPFQPETVGGTAHKHHHHHMNNVARQNKLLDSTQPKMAFAYGYGDTPREWERKSTYSGYEGWEITSPLYDNYTGPATVGGVGADGNHQRPSSAAQTKGALFEEKVVLPNFEMDDPRKFKSRPGSARPGTSRWIDSDYFEVDDTGRVALPQFAEKP